MLSTLTAGHVLPIRFPNSDWWVGCVLAAQGGRCSEPLSVYQELPLRRASNTEGPGEENRRRRALRVCHSSISSSFVVRALRQERAASQELVGNVLHLSPA
jgi:hypothetical protein